MASIFGLKIEQIKAQAFQQRTISPTNVLLSQQVLWTPTLQEAQIIYFILERRVKL